MGKSDAPVFKKTDPVILCLIILLAFYIRTLNLEAAAMWIDEAFRFSHSSQPLDGMFLQYAADSHPPLYGLALHFWMSKGDTLYRLRFLSVIFSAFSLVAVWLLFRKFLSPRQAVFAVFLTAISPFHIAMAQEMNYPSMMFLLCSIVVLTAVYFAEKPMFRYIAASVVFSVAALLTHYNAVFLIFAINAALAIYFLAERSWRPLAAWLGGQIAFAAVVLMLARSLPSQAGRLLHFLPVENIIAHLRSLPVGGIPRVYKSLLLGEHFGAGGTIELAAMSAMLLLAGAGIWLAWRDMARRERILIFVILFLAPVVGYVMMLTTGLFFLPKYYFYLQPLLLILILRGWGSARRAAVRWTVFAVIALLFSISLARYYGALKVSEDNRTVIVYIEKNFSGGDILLLNPPYLSLLFDFYAPDTLPPRGVPKNYDRKKPYSELKQITDEELASLGEQVARHRRVWAFYGLGTKTRVDQRGRVADMLMKKCEIEEKREYHMVPLQPTLGVLYVFKNCM